MLKQRLLWCHRAGGRTSGAAGARHEASAALVDALRRELARRIVLELKNAHPEVHGLAMDSKFQGQVQRETPVADVRGIVRIIMLLPCRAAAPVRAKASDVLVRYLGGDGRPRVSLNRPRVSLDRPRSAEGQPRSA